MRENYPDIVSRETKRILLKYNGLGNVFKIVICLTSNPEIRPMLSDAQLIYITETKDWYTLGDLMGVVYN